MSHTLDIVYRRATSQDFARCIEIRGKTNDNPVPAGILNSLGINEQSWGPLIENGSILGYVSLVDNQVVAFCFGDTNSGEVLVLACLPSYENKGLGKSLLELVSKSLFQKTFKTLWLAASVNPEIRAHGFYRYLGWKPTGRLDHNGDEILELDRE